MSDIMICKKCAKMFLKRMSKYFSLQFEHT